MLLFSPKTQTISMTTLTYEFIVYPPQES